MAWLHIISGRPNAHVVNEFRVIFGDKDYFELRRHHAVHVSYLGLSNDDPYALLAKRPHEIDVQDDQGLTLLAWAVLKDDVHFATALLDAGAEISMKDNVGMGPLTYSALAEKPAMMDLLIRRGARNEFNVRKASTLHMAAFKQNDSEYIRILMESDLDIDINCRDNIGATPLSFATVRDHDRSVRSLCEYGADLGLNHSKAWGNTRSTYLHTAILCNSSRSMGVLLEFGADINSVNIHGMTPVHYLAQHANRQTLRAAMAHEDRFLAADIDAINHEGLTASKILRSRRDLKDEDSGAFEFFLQKVRGRQESLLTLEKEKIDLGVNESSVDPQAEGLIEGMAADLAGSVSSLDDIFFECE